MPEEALLTIDDLTVTFPAERGQVLRAADGVSMSIYPGQTLAVVGESGSGKSVSAMTVLQLVPTPPGKYESGHIWWKLRENWPSRDLLELSDKEMRKIRGAEIAMIFQEPMTSLNPVYTTGDQLLEAILLHQETDRAGAMEIAWKSLRDVGIADPTARLRDYPHQLSGGMRQRVMIAMALACEPRLLLADEPTTALDVTIQAQILELLRDIQKRRGMSVMLITHDLGVVAENADVVAVMYAGRVCEYADVVTLFERPQHPYTKGLLGSMPVLGTKHGRLPTVMDGATPGDAIPDWLEVAPHVIEMKPGERYGGDDAQLYEIEPGHWVLGKADASKQDKATPPKLAYRRSVISAQSD